MMHGREKSDSAIVAEKPTNKAVPTAAEPVERRAGAKGNANQQSTDRAQNRATVSQALERIRKVAKERKKERFIALFHHISNDLLDEAFYELKENAAAGVDGLTWRDYEQNLERNLEDLHARVHRGAYRALPSRRVYIPKPDGRQRPLAVALMQAGRLDDAEGQFQRALARAPNNGWSCRVGRGRAYALPLPARSNGSCSFPASRFPMRAPLRHRRRIDAGHEIDQPHKSEFLHQPW